MGVVITPPTMVVTGLHAPHTGDRVDQSGCPFILQRVVEDLPCARNFQDSEGEGASEKKQGPGPVRR